MIFFSLETSENEKLCKNNLFLKKVMKLNLADITISSREDFSEFSEVRRLTKNFVRILSAKYKTLWGIFEKFVSISEKRSLALVYLLIDLGG